MPHIDINNEFILVPSINGMRITNPNHAHSESRNTIKRILEFPFNIYFQTPGGETIFNCNEQVLITHKATALGYSSVRDLINKPLENFAKRDYIKKIRAFDKKVLASKQLMISEDEVIMPHDDEIIHMISFKFPCYYENKKDPIIFGASILLDNHGFPESSSLSDGITTLFQSGLITHYTWLNQFFGKQAIDDIHITPKQQQCLKLAAHGLTAKKIGARLDISHRTVERHFENLKHKLGVKTKSELIEKYLNHFPSST